MSFVCVESKDKYVRDQKAKFGTTFAKRHSTVFAWHGSYVTALLPATCKHTIDLVAHVLKVAVSQAVGVDLMCKFILQGILWEVDTRLHQGSNNPHTPTCALHAHHDVRTCARMQVR